MTTLSAYDIWQRFRLLHPKSREAFINTPENVERWQYHIVHADRICLAPPVVQTIVDDGTAFEFMRSRAVNSWDEMRPGVRAAYAYIASFFPGEQVFAVGSRVNGDYVDAWDGPEVREMRSRIGKAPKDRSDFDFWIDPRADNHAGPLPEYADRLFYLPPGEKKIPIPMWDFSRLPEPQHPAAAAAFYSGNVAALINLHNAYSLSPHTYCGCGGDEASVMRWFQHGIETGQIKTTLHGTDDDKITTS